MANPFTAVRNFFAARFHPSRVPNRPAEARSPKRSERPYHPPPEMKHLQSRVEPSPAPRVVVPRPLKRRRAKVHGPIDPPKRNRTSEGVTKRRKRKSVSRLHSVRRRRNQNRRTGS